MRKVRFGIIGTNFISDWMLAGARHDSRFEPVAVCSRSQDTADAFAARHNIPHTFTSLEAMAASPLIDAVYIASPNFMHATQSILCMAHGKHTLCEKPMASNAREAKAMIEASERHGVTLMEAMKPTLSPGVREVMRNIGKAGTIRRYFASYCQYSSRYDKLKNGIVLNAFNPAYSNGAIMDIGVYTIYPMVALFGMPREITASGILLPSGADGQGTAVFKYDGMEASVIYSKIADSQLPAEIQGEDGTITIDRINQPEKVVFTPRGTNNGGGSHPPLQAETWSPDVTPDLYHLEMTEFINLIESRQRQSLINSHTNSLHTMMILDEIRRQIGVRFPADMMA